MRKNERLVERRALEEGRKRESLVGLGATGERVCRTQGMLGEVRAL